MRACGKGAHINASKWNMCNISLNENSHVWIPRGNANIGFLLNLSNHSCTFIFILSWLQKREVWKIWLVATVVNSYNLLIPIICSIVANFYFLGSCTLENKLMSLQAHCDHKTCVLSKVICQELDLKTI